MSDDISQVAIFHERNKLCKRVTLAYYQKVITEWT